ncbi:MAG: hypothetical protein KatS3mg105_0946 [Gemmatales bacterium]|nr:MAG: hypothetical protein KatS3mg105_0946 [Gemmatales bacterium]
MAAWASIRRNIRFRGNTNPAFKFDVPPPQRCRASGFNFVSLPDAIYVAAGRKLLRFDLETGKQLSAWPAPDLEPDLCWGSLRIDGDRLVATLFRPQDLIDAQAGYDGNGGDWAGDRMPMAWLVVLDRHAGKVEWKRKANWGFVNRSGIALGAGKIFCVDLVMPGVLKKWKSARRTLPEARPMLYALDIASGKEIWSQALDVRVKNIAYSEERDLLLAPCRNLMVWKDGEWRDLSFDIRRGKTNRNAPGKMLAFQGSSGKIVWQVDSDAYFDPHIVLHDLIIDRHGVTYDLRTGKRHQRKSSLTGQPEWWSFRKSGCNHLIACENLVTWRTAFFDLEHQSGVCSLTGMDAGCSPTLLPAGGILNIPNFGTHHKRNRMTAMALVHRPDNQLWTRYFSSREGYEGEPAPIRQAGFNFGAPGDRIADDGTLWLQVAQQNKAFVTVQPKEVEWFQHYAGSWIAGSGIIGVETIRIPVVLSSKSNDNTSRHYTIRLYFFEPENRQPGQRVFDVQIEGKTVLSNVDISKEAGIQKAIVRELDNVEVRGPLDIRLVPKAGKTILSGIELRRH